MQEAFREHHGLQCGFCTPGMIMTAVDLVARKGHHLDEHVIREELEGNICRCTGYHNIVKAVAAGAKAMGAPVESAADRGRIGRGRHEARSASAAMDPAHGEHDAAETVSQSKISMPERGPQPYGRVRTIKPPRIAVSEETMTATGIGAPVRRLEDQRYITGKGHYVDDVNRHGQAYAYFLRSPHAHARIASIDTAEAAVEPGVVAIFTGQDLADDKIGGLICGWMIHSKDGSPMKAGPHPALAQGKVRYVGDHVAVVIAETYAEAKDAAEKIVVDYEVLRRRGRDRPEPARRAANPSTTSRPITPCSSSTSATRTTPRRPSPARHM